MKGNIIKNLAFKTDIKMKQRDKEPQLMLSQEFEARYLYWEK